MCAYRPFGEGLNCEVQMTITINTRPVKTAHYVHTRTRQFVSIVTNGRLSDGVEYDVTSKDDARRIAAEHGAKPWNF